jgi:hypothetical protein
MGCHTVAFGMFCLTLEPSIHAAGGGLAYVLEGFPVSILSLVMLFSGVHWVIVAITHYILVGFQWSFILSYLFHREEKSRPNQSR